MVPQGLVHVTSALAGGANGILFGSRKQNESMLSVQQGSRGCSVCFVVMPGQDISFVLAFCACCFPTGGEMKQNVLMRAHVFAQPGKKNGHHGTGPSHFSVNLVIRCLFRLPVVF